LKNSGWILVVEDDNDIAELTKEFLESEGYVTKVAVNGKDALLQLTKSIILPMLIITDFMMPVMNGGELIKNIKHDVRLRTVPVIVMSGSYLVAEQSVRGVPILSKPLRTEHLMRKVTEMLLNNTISA
jgi:CheY-like chemotaxis protein